jgi:hypothetical protein
MDAISLPELAGELIRMMGPEPELPIPAGDTMMYHRTTDWYHWRTTTPHIKAKISAEWTNPTSHRMLSLKRRRSKGRRREMRANFVGKPAVC